MTAQAAQLLTAMLLNQILFNMVLMDYSKIHLLVQMYHLRIFSLMIVYYQVVISTDSLKDCCKLMLKLLTILRDESKITKDEFDKHAELKIKFLE